MKYSDHIARLDEDFRDEWAERAAIMGEGLHGYEAKRAEVDAYYRVCQRRRIRPEGGQGALF